jgi:hypothetical protein
MLANDKHLVFKDTREGWVLKQSFDSLEEFSDWSTEARGEVQEALE